MPRVPVVGAAVHRCRDRQPRVERRHRRVRAQRELDAVVEHPAEREAALGPARPGQLGEVAVIEEVGRLHAGADTELGHPAYVVATDQLGVLDRADRPRLGVRRKCLGDRRVADRVGGDLEAAAVCSLEQVAELVAGEVGLAGGVLQPVRVGVGLAAPGRAGVERPVADDLERPHRDPLVAAGQRVAGAQAGVDHLVEGVGVRRPPDPQHVAVLGPAVRPELAAPAELEVDQADHASGGRRVEGAAERLRRRSVAAEGVTRRG